MCLLGDTICRRIFTFNSIQHRLAVAFLSGLLLSSWTTYLLALLFSQTAQPLLWANLIFFALAVGLIFLLRHRAPGEQPGDDSFRRLFAWTSARRVGESDQDTVNTPLSEEAIRFDADTRPVGNPMWDWLCLGACLIFGCWLMFATLDFADGSFEFAIKSWSDFGANLSLSQSLALAQNFPTEHPFFPGETVRYHFLFWFQAANLSFLGVNLVWSVNLLSMLSLAALLILIMTFAELLFNSRVVGRIAAVLFFFASSSLSYIPFLYAQTSLGGAMNSILNLHDFVKSGYPFRGEDWGGLTIGVFANQRHLISAAGILLIVMVYLIDLYRRKGVVESIDYNIAAEPPETEDETVQNLKRKTRPSIADFRGEAAGLIFCGALIGLLPYWNSAVFVSAAIVLGSLFVFFPFRRYLAVLIGTVIVLGLPQLLMLRSGNLARTSDTLFNVGYTIPNPTIPLVFEYIGWTFGLKWILLLVAAWFVPNAHRRLLLVITTLVPVVFLFQLSTDAFNNHKLLNIWSVLASVYVAYALWFIGRKGIVRAALAVILAVVMVFGAFIDLFPIHNDAFVKVPHTGDRLTTWLFENTRPGDIFLTDTLLSHPILFTGRKIFLGNTLFAWTAGYELGERENAYRTMFQENDLQKLGSLLRENKIAFVAIDEGVRANGSIKGLNEAVYKQNFEKVFDDTEHRYGNLVIYRVPLDPAGISQDQPNGTAVETPNPDIPAATAFTDGPGNGRGQLLNPRGLAVDTEGNFYVADTMNARVQKFSADGNFLASIGQAGPGEGQLREPNGVAIDGDGNIFTVDALNHRLIKFDSNGSFVKEWAGPEPFFFGPRAVVQGPSKELYILDQGNARVVVFDPETEKNREWGTRGSGQGEMADPTGLEVGDDRVYVTDTGNNRIQVFDLKGKFVAAWPVPEWNAANWLYPDAIFDPQANHLYVTNPIDKEILVFDINGNRLEPLRPTDPAALDNPSALVLSTTKTSKRLYVLNTGSSKVFVFDLGSTGTTEKMTKR